MILGRSAGELGAVLVMVVVVLRRAVVGVLVMALAVVVPAHRGRGRRTRDHPNSKTPVACSGQATETDVRAGARPLEARRPRQRCPVEEDSG